MDTIATAGAFPIAQFRDELSVSAERSGLRVRCRSGGWSEAALRDGSWLRAQLQTQYLVDGGFAIPVRDGWLLPADRLDAALRAGFTLPLLWSDWNPFRLRLSAGFANRTSSALQVGSNFRAGGSSVVLERYGRYLRRPSCPDRSWLMDANTAAILDVVESAAAQPPSTPGARARLIGWLRDAGTEVGADLGGCLAPGAGRDPDEVAAHNEESWRIDSEGLSHADFLRLSPSMLEAAVAAMYQHRGCLVALLPPGNGFGVAVLARTGQTVELAFVDTRGTGSPVTLEAILAAESSIRATMPASALRSTVFSRKERDVAACASLMRRGIEVIGGRLFSERLRSRGVNAAVAANWQKYRCRTFADGIRILFEVTC